MNKEESANLMNDPVFRGRVKVSALSFATTILNEQPTVEGHAGRYRWAQMVGMQPDVEAARLQPMVVMDPAVQQSGSDIDDQALQGAVEAVAKKFI